MIDEDAIYQCSPKNGKCSLNYKKCSDFSVDNCYTNYNCILSKDGKKCIDYRDEDNNGGEDNNGVEDNNGDEDEDSWNNNNLIKVPFYGLYIIILLLF